MLTFVGVDNVAVHSQFTKAYLRPHLKGKFREEIFGIGKEK